MKLISTSFVLVTLSGAIQVSGFRLFSQWWGEKAKDNVTLAPRTTNLDRIRVSEDGYYKDKHNRTMIFHGTNVVEKKAPYLPILEGPACTTQFDKALCLKDIKQLQSWGFNVVRLGVMWVGVNPLKDYINNTYLEQVESLVRTLYDHGIYTIIDAHQDLLHESLCGEGIPDYIAEIGYKAGGWEGGSHEFPWPIGNPFQLTNKTVTGFPVPSEKDCKTTNLATVQWTKKTQTLWEQMYDNDEILDYFGKAWAAVAKRLKNTPGVLGYETINEPMNTGAYHLFSRFTTSISDVKTLTKMYTTVHNAIRAVDDSTILFFSSQLSNMLFSLFGSSWTTDFDQYTKPGGLAFRDRTSWTTHFYCQADYNTGDVPSYWFCDKQRGRSMASFEGARKRMKTANLLTEFGAVGNTPNAVKLLDAIQADAQMYKNGWIYWQYKSFDDITSMTGKAEQFYNADGSLQKEKIEALTTTYAQAVAGDIVSLKGNRDGFELVYKPNIPDRYGRDGDSNVNDDIRVQTSFYLQKPLFKIRFLGIDQSSKANLFGYEINGRILTVTHDAAELEKGIERTFQITIEH